MLVTQPNLHRNNTSIQRQLPDPQSLRATKKSQNIKATKLSQTEGNAKIRQAMVYPAKKSPHKQKPPIQKIYSQLHDYINTVDTKIQYLLQKQSNEYKVVYQHYYNKFKDQLYELKQKTLEQEQIFLKNDHVHYIQNQLKISRQQASTYQNLYRKSKLQNDTLRASLELHKRDITILQANAKDYLKQIKALKQKLHYSNQKSIPFDHLNHSNSPQEPTNTNNYPHNTNQSPQKYNESLQKYNEFSQKYNISPQKYRLQGSNRRSNSISFQIPQKPQIMISLDQIPIKFNCLKSDSKISPKISILSAVANQIRSQSIQLVQSIQPIQGIPKYHQKLGFSIKVPIKQKQYLKTQITQKAQNKIKVFNMCEWFLQCVESVKKQILQRKSKYFNEVLRISNKFMNMDSLEDFLNLDKLQVLKIFLSKKQCIQIVYNLLKNQINIQQNSEVYKISHYQNSSETSKFERKNENSKTSNFQSNESLNHTIFNMHEKINFNKTSVPVNSFNKKRIQHRSLNEKQILNCVTNGTNGNQKTSNSLTKDALNRIQESGGPLSFKNNFQRPLTIADLVQKRNPKRLTQIIREKKNIRLSTHLVVRKKRMIQE